MKPRFALLLGALLLANCGKPAAPALPVTLSFPEFPQNTATLDLGQSLTVEVEAANDGGVGVRWSCQGPACGVLKPTPQAITFKAIGLTGQATLTATSLKQPSVSRSMTVKVGLNESPDQLCK
jgi:hypothetical protein